ncbi:MAG: hypothetical protein J0L69_15560 [Bacteroidetes bacterium]|nr:hypothetical protein [Bacteroidota bacterium]
MKKIGGLSALTIGALYIVITYLYVSSGKLPDDPTKALKHLNTYRCEWIGIIILSIITDILFIPLIISLFNNLSKNNLYQVSVGSALIILFVVIDLIYTWPGYIQLLRFSEDSKSFLALSQNSFILLSSSSLIKMLNSPLSAFYLISLPSIGIALVCLGIPKSSFGSTGKVLGYVIGITGVMSSVGFTFFKPFGIGFILTSILTILWLFAIGYKLLKLIDP